MKITKLSGIDQSKVADLPKPKNKEQNTARTARNTIIAGGGATLVGYMLKDGILDGFKKIGNVCTNTSNVISSFFAFTFPFLIARNEHATLTGKSLDDTIFNRMVYAAASLGYSPQTVSEPLVDATKSQAHLITNLINMPHIAYTFLTYTCGRFLSTVKAIERNFNKDKSEDYRLEQEFNALYNVGNLGSVHAAVIPLSSQFVTGWQTIFNVAKGNFSDVWDNFKHEPITVAFGTLFNTWTWPFEWLSKFADTSIRTAENVDQIRNAFGETSPVIKSLDAYRNWWHKKAKDKSSVVGGLLHKAREFSKMEALILPPIGMASLVIPPMNKYFRGELFNAEAQEKGGVVSGLDKIFSTVGLGLHSFYTVAYGICMRLPQTLTTSLFYGTKALNWVKGCKPEDDHYLDPLDVREKIFNTKFVNKISTWAEKKLNNMENAVNGNDAVVDMNGEKKCKHVRTFTDLMANEVAWEPIRELYYGHQVKQNSGVKPSSADWADFVEEKKEFMLNDAMTNFEEYLQEAPQFNEEQIEYFKERDDWKEIEALVKDAIEKEITNNRVAQVKEEDKKPTIINNVEIPDKFGKLLTKPKALFEVLKLRTFHSVFTVLPMWIKGFINVVDFGKKDEKMWYRNFKAQETGIREGDVTHAVRGEFMPVVAYLFQNAGKGISIFDNIFGSTRDNLLSPVYSE